MKKDSMNNQKAVSTTKRDEWETLFLIRLLYLTYFMALGCIQPFLPLYFHSLGHGGAVIGVIGSISPFTTVLVAPLWGMISDWTGNPFFVLYITCAVSMVGQLLVGIFDDPRYIMLMVCLTAVFGAPVKPLIDSLVMDQLSDRAQYGKMRLWSLIGTGFATSVAGRFLNDEYQNVDMPIVGENSTLTEKMLMFWQSLAGYKLLFFAHAVLHIPAFICIRRFQKLHARDKSVPKKKLQTTSGGIKDVATYIFRDVDAVLFFSLVFALGISAAIGDNFAYVRFREVGGSGGDMGMSRLLCSFAGAAMFWFSGDISAMLGMETVFGLSLLSVGLRFTLFCFMDKNPYYGYAAEMIRGMVFGCFWSTSTVYASQIAPHEVQATMVRKLEAGAYCRCYRSPG
jgi:PPP family 3-phenylpropionic acid transporter